MRTDSLRSLFFSKDLTEPIPPPHHHPTHTYTHARTFIKGKRKYGSILSVSRSIKILVPATKKNIVDDTYTAPTAFTQSCVLMSVSTDSCYIADANFRRRTLAHTIADSVPSPAAIPNPTKTIVMQPKRKLTFPKVKRFPSAPSIPSKTKVCGDAHGPI